MAFEQLEQRQVVARYLRQGAPALQRLALAGQRQVGLAVCQAAAHDLGQLSIELQRRGALAKVLEDLLKRTPPSCAVDLFTLTTPCAGWRVPPPS